MDCTPKVKALKTAAFGLWLASAAAALLHLELGLRLIAPLVALCCCLLIVSSRSTQGHYRRISASYAVGIGIWFVADCLALLAYLLPGRPSLAAAAEYIRLIPDVFFALGLVFFMHSEYNLPHFQRVVLHTFAICFPAYLIFQKLLRVHWSLNTRHLDLFGSELYFFVLVFTVVMVLTIFVQTNFKGHTTGTNFSAVALVFYNLSEMRRIVLRANGVVQNSLLLSALYLLTIVIYAQAQSDPKLIDRGQESDAPDERKLLKSRNAWFNAIAGLAGTIGLFGIGFFDERDLYTMLIAIMAYLFVFRTIQANELNTRLLEREIMENAKLEKLVSEKTRELREVNRHLEHLSSTDELTGLRNRRYGLEKITALSADPERRPFSLFLMDLNTFKAINDTYGHDAGDEVLKQVGARLDKLSGERLTATRLGGDEFLLILSPSSGPEEAEQLAQRICRVMDEPVEAAGERLQVSACVGIAFFPTDAEDLETLYQHADQAMYSLKHKKPGSSYRFFQPEPEKAS